MTRMTKRQERNREIVENALCSLGTAVVLKQQTYIRIKQAIQKDGTMVMLLSPALDDISRMEISMKYAMKALGHVWKNESDWDWPLESRV